MKNEEIVILTAKQLDDIVFYASRRACTNLYKGLTNAYLERFDSDLATIIKDIDYIKLHLKQQAATEEVQVKEVEHKIFENVPGVSNDAIKALADKFKGKDISEYLYTQVVNIPNIVPNINVIKSLGNK